MRPAEPLRVALLVAVLLACTLGACQQHPSEELAKQACRNQFELQYWHGFDKDAEAKQLAGQALADAKRLGSEELAGRLSSPDWSAKIDECTRKFTDSAAESQAECVAAAQSVKAARQCVGAK